MFYFNLLFITQSPHRPADDNNSLGRVEGVSQKETLSEVKIAAIHVPLDCSASGTQINSDITNTTQSTSNIGFNINQNMSSSVGQRENMPSSIVQRENSSVTLNNMLNFNKVATPNKATKLNSDDIFSPIPIGKVQYILFYIG